MRSLLLVPMDDARAVEAALASDADALVLDVAGSGADAAARDRARSQARDILRSAQIATEGPQIYIRLEGLDQEAFDLDLGMLAVGEPDCILLGGCRSGMDVQHLGARLAVQEAEYGLTDGAIGIIAEAGSQAAALFTLGTYAAASDRLFGLTWHAERLAVDLGSHHDLETVAALPPLQTARHLVLFAARGAEVTAIDAPSLSRNPDTILAECRAARLHGFNAKMATTTEEVAIINAVFGYEAP